ncbi:hypothetical protein I7I48_10777 [Histoplasma ohiense]|nr:hypothetical protein I7I48_10777 [Histoplasma ohiense (nom. inval.)]
MSHLSPVIYYGSMVSMDMYRYVQVHCMRGTNQRICPSRNMSTSVHTVIFRSGHQQPQPDDQRRRYHHRTCWVARHSGLRPRCPCHPIHRDCPGPRTHSRFS